MKSVRTLLTICLLFTAATLLAQSESQWLMKVHVPYNFTVANQPMPAGIYNVYRVSSQGMIRITNVDGKHTAIVNTLLDYSGSASPNSRLVFSQFGSEYFLTQIWSGGDDVSRNAPPGKKAQELASAGTLSQTTTIVAFTNSR